MTREQKQIARRLRANQQVGERRGKQIGRAAAARKLLILVYYGLRDGEIRCPYPADVDWFFHRATNWAFELCQTQNSVSPKMHSSYRIAELGGPRIW